MRIVNSFLAFARTPAVGSVSAGVQGSVPLSPWFVPGADPGSV
ncbi:MAG TPA: hypothetical protein VFD01_07715 [Candidatus Dormibacteraeota bacterium]|nr:hypothetical protein [Candidatus Dormibacteraeota bacterium]